MLTYVKMLLHMHDFCRKCIFPYFHQITDLKVNNIFDNDNVIQPHKSIGRKVDIFHNKKACEKMFSFFLKFLRKIDFQLFQFFGFLNILASCERYNLLNCVPIMFKL